MITFEEAFRQTKTTKYYHKYHRHYQSILGSKKIDSVLEIGAYKGQSLYSWKLVWPNALIEAVDLDRRYDLKLEDDFKIYNIDTTDKEAVDKNITRTYDVVIDDGAHHWLKQTETFFNMYHKAEKFYVLEDIQGEHSLEKLKGTLPPVIFENSLLYTPQDAPTRDFKFGNIVEHRGLFKLMFIPAGIEF
jgi:hypothetical protein